MFDVMEYTQYLFNSTERQGRRRNVGGITSQVRGLKRDQTLFVGTQLHHATLAKTSIVSHMDQRERLTV